MLLLYHTSMSSKNSGDWNEFDYKTQVIPLGFKKLLWAIKSMWQVWAAAQAGR